MAKFSPKLKNLEKLGMTLTHEDWVQSAEVINTVTADGNNVEYESQYLKVKPTKGRTVQILGIWGSFRVKGADHATKQLFVDFFDRYGYVLT